MTTASSLAAQLKAQADRIAAILKAAERGEKIDTRFAEKIAAARSRETFKVGIMMDDKLVTIDIPWATISTSDEAALAEFIVGLMKRAPQ